MDCSNAQQTSPILSTGRNIFCLAKKVGGSWQALKTGKNAKWLTSKCSRLNSESDDYIAYTKDSSHDYWGCC